MLERSVYNNRPIFACKGFHLYTAKIDTVSSLVDNSVDNSYILWITQHIVFNTTYRSTPQYMSGYSYVLQRVRAYTVGMVYSFSVPYIVPRA